METNYYPYQKGSDGYFHLGPNTLGTIRTTCLQRGTLYEDPEFLPSQTSIFGRNPTDGKQIRWDGSIYWKRPIELVEYPNFISDGVSRFDVIQGELGNCWFIAAVANLTMHQGLFSQVVPVDNGTFRPGTYCGAFHFRFWQYGHWVDIIIDDRLPVSRRGELLFLHSSDRKEFWSALLEKAYAKLHGSYASLSGGTPSEALQDFSGGIIEAVEIDSRKTNLFSHMRKSYLRSSLMSCSLSGDGGRFEQKTREGLVTSHAYSVTGVEVVQLTTGRNVSLLRLRNPWGDNSEWRGSWSDGSREWNSVHPHIRANLGVTNRSDGEFWMEIGDFQRHFTRLEICHLSPDPIDSGINRSYGKPWNKETIYGSWVRGISAGGCLNHRTFAQNPQYFFHFEASDEDGDADKCTVIVGLLQKRPKRDHTDSRSRRGHAIGFRMYKVNAYYSPGEKLDLNFFKRQGGLTLTSGDYIDAREVSGRFEVPTGNYVIIPSTYDPDEEGEFLLRTFSEPSSRPAPIQYTVTQYVNQFGGEVKAGEKITTPPLIPPPTYPANNFPNLAPSLPLGYPVVNYPTPQPNLPPPNQIINFPNPYAASSPYPNSPVPHPPTQQPALPYPLLNPVQNYASPSAPDLNSQSTNHLYPTIPSQGVPKPIGFLFPPN